MTAVLVSILIIVPALGMGDTNALYNWLLDLNAAVMPLRYLWVFLAYIALTKMSDKFSSSYTFVKNRKVARAFGIWCFAFTAFACIMGMFPKDAEIFSQQWITMAVTNFATPFVLIGLGLILPKIAKKVNKVEEGAA